MKLQNKQLPLEFDTSVSSVHMNFSLDDTSFEKAQISAVITHAGGNMVLAARLPPVFPREHYGQKKYRLKYCTTSWVVYCHVSGIIAALLFCLYHFSGGIFAYQWYVSHLCIINMAQLDKLYRQWLDIQPLSADDEKRLKRKFMLDFNYNSNHIEGNTLTYGQTEVLLLFGEVIGSAKMKDLEEMKAHNICLNMVEREADTDEPLTETFIRQVHQVMLREDYKVYRQLPGGETTSYTVHAGRYKTRPNSVITPTGERFEYASPEETPALMADLVQWYNNAISEGTLTPVQLAALFHYRYIRIHPFEDGNGRIARLMVNFILRRHSWPMMVIRSKNKKAYLNALGLADAATGPIPADGAHASLKSVAPFVEYIESALTADISSMLEFLSGDREMMWWYEGEIVRFSTPTPARILRVLQSNPNASLSAISTTLGISRSAIQKQMDNLAEKGYISRPEGKKRGWIVNMTSVISYEI